VTVFVGIDPGPTHSGFVLLDCGRITHVWSAAENAEIRKGLAVLPGLGIDYCVGIEQIRSYGMAVGADVFDTCVETGRFVQVLDGNAILIPRNEIKMHLCHSPRAKDANIRQALIDRLGPQGTKKSPGPTHGVSKHAWSALAVAVTLMDRTEARRAP
jgi:hypothetical protein